jgi:phosphoribosylanthranilate isomerase
MASRVPTLALALLFAPFSDFFLTDTLLLPARPNQSIVQPEQGFVGITGKVCDWKMAEKLVRQSKIPVILAGGISPENVYDGILQVQPAGIDSCTHTNLLDESGNPVRFRKNPEKIIQLMEETRRAELHINSQKMKEQTTED